MAKSFVDIVFRTFGRKRVKRDLKNIGSDANNAANNVRTLTNALKGLVAVYTAGKLIDTIRQFEKSIAVLGGITKATAAQLNNLANVARKTGATTRFTATEAAEGLTFLARAGFSVDESIAALPATLNLAIAGVLELGEAADIASNVLRQFNIEAENTERVVDVLAAVANSSNTTVRQLAEALKFAGPFAASLGRSVEETAAAIGTLGDAGIQASLAGTNLRGIFARLIEPTKKAKVVFDNLNISLEDINPASRTLSQIFNTLRKSGISAADALTIFGRRNVSAALAIINSTEKLDKLNVVANQSKGTTQSLADAIDDTLDGAIKRLISSVEEAILQLGDSEFGKTLRNVIELTTQAIRVFTGIADESEDVSMAARALAKAFEAAAIAAKIFIGLKLLKFFGDLGVRFSSTSLSIKKGVGSIVLSAKLAGASIRNLGLNLNNLQAASFLASSGIRKLGSSLLTLSKRAFASLKSLTSLAKGFIATELAFELFRIANNMAEINKQAKALNKNFGSINADETIVKLEAAVREAETGLSGFGDFILRNVGLAFVSGVSQARENLEKVKEAVETTEKNLSRTFENIEKGAQLPGIKEGTKSFELMSARAVALDLISKELGKTQESLDLLFSSNAEEILNLNKKYGVSTDVVRTLVESNVNLSEATKESIKADLDKIDSVNKLKEASDKLNKTLNEITKSYKEINETKVSSKAVFDVVKELKESSAVSDELKMRFLSLESSIRGVQRTISGEFSRALEDLDEASTKTSVEVNKLLSGVDEPRLDLRFQKYSETLQSLLNEIKSGISLGRKDPLVSSLVGNPESIENTTNSLGRLIQASKILSDIYAARVKIQNPELFPVDDKDKEKDKTPSEIFEEEFAKTDISRIDKELDERQLQLDNFNKMHEDREFFNQLTLEQREMLNLTIEELEAKHQERLVSLIGTGQLSASQLEKISFANRLKAGAQFLNAQLQGVEANNKALFEVQKTAALALALINGYQSVVASYKFGAEIGGPIVGAAFAAITAAAQFANIQKIVSTKYGDRGGGVGSVGGGGASPSAADSQSTVSNQPVTETNQPINISFVVDENTNSGFLRQLIDEITVEETEEGVTPLITVQGAS